MKAGTKDNLFRHQPVTERNSTCARTLSLSYADLFADRIIQHLQRCGIDMSQTTWQTDNGSEFIGSWQAKDDSAFTKTVQRVPGQAHRTIPPGQHRFQADVETVHSLMETEFFEIEPFAGRQNFIDKATTYQLFFNLARKNSGKENKTLWELVNDKHPRADPRLPLLPPVYLDKLFHERLHSKTPGGYDVWALPYFPQIMGFFHNRSCADGESDRGNRRLRRLFMSPAARYNQNVKYTN